jgi:hypothetical protein
LLIQEEFSLAKFQTVIIIHEVSLVVAFIKPEQDKLANTAASSREQLIWINFT